jgi:hypothetical protein
LTLKEKELELVILDSVQDDVETVSNMMNLVREWAEVLPRELTRDDVAAIVLRLLHQGLVEAYQETEEGLELVDPATDVQLPDVHALWFKTTPKGHLSWSNWSPSVEPSSWSEDA